MREIISARQASIVLGCSPQKVRERMKSGAWRIGIVTGTGSRYSYDVSVQKLAQMLGRTPEELAERIDG